MDSTNMEITITNDVDLQNHGGSSGEHKLLTLELKKKIAAAKEKSDLLNQELHELKRSTAHYQEMTEETNSVLENLRSEADQCHIRKEILKQSKEREIIFPLKEQLRNLEDEINSLEEASSEANILREKIASLRKQKEIDTCNKSSEFKLSKQQLREENEELEKEILIKQQMIDSKINKIAEFEEKEKYLSISLVQTKEILESVRSELHSVNEEIKEFNDEIALLESQMITMKSKPLDEGTRGNCLFGEIDERGALLMKKMKQLNKAHADTMQFVSRSASTLKKLKIEYLAMVEESKRNEETAINQETSSADNLNLIKKLEEEYKALEQEYHDMPCIADPEETTAYKRYINYIIDKPQQEAKDMRNRVQEYSASCLDVGKTLQSKMTKLIQVQSSLYIEEARNAKLTSLLQDYKKSESKIEDIKISIVEKSTDESWNETKTGNNVAAVSSSSNVANQENIKPEKDKKRPQLKFVDIQKKINLDDL